MTYLSLPFWYTGVTLVGKQACAPGRVPLILAEGNVTFQTKSGSLETQLLASHAALRVPPLQMHCPACCYLAYSLHALMYSTRCKAAHQVYHMAEIAM